MPLEGSTTARGFSVMELMIVVTILLILAAIEIPNLMRARMAANQAAAVENLKTIEAAEVTYAVTYNHGYTPTLAELGPSGQSASSQAASLIDGLLSHGKKDGYSYLYIPGPVVDGKVETYSLKAVPSMPCTTGDQYYSMDPSNESSVVTQNFQSVVQNDFIAQVLKGSIGHGQTTCAQ
jgi:prepilin-type N-terminal cleavage/methylation domain-containing protein